MQYKLNGRLNFVRNEDSLLVDIPGRITDPVQILSVRPGDVLLFTKFRPGDCLIWDNNGTISIYILARETAVTTEASRTQEEVT